MSKFQIIPCIYAGNLPTDVHNELSDWQDELCFHGDGGCVFHIWSHTLPELPLFQKWMIEIGAWTPEQVAATVGHTHLTVAMTGT